jgi:hypothetical protein
MMSNNYGWLDKDRMICRNHQFRVSRKQSVVSKRRFPVCHGVTEESYSKRERGHILELIGMIDDFEID